MNSTYIEEDEMHVPNETMSNGRESNVHKFYAMSDEEHKALGHIKDSTNSWVDPTNYVDTYNMDW